jgi:hypothetical protein
VPNGAASWYYPGTTTGLSTLQVVVVDTPDLCGGLEGISALPTKQLFLVFTVSASSLVPGTYDVDGVTSGALAAAGYYTDETACTDAAMAGTITLVAVTQTLVTGRFDLAFNGGNLSGEFSAPGGCPVAAPPITVYC